jgi:hypothetical protein
MNFAEVLLPNFIPVVVEEKPHQRSLSLRMSSRPLIEHLQEWHSIFMLENLHVWSRLEFIVSEEEIESHIFLQGCEFLSESLGVRVGDVLPQLFKSLLVALLLAVLGPLSLEKLLDIGPGIGDIGVLGLFGFVHKRIISRI